MRRATLGTAGLVAVLASCAVTPRLPAYATMTSEDALIAQAGVADVVDDAVRHLVARYSAGPTRWQLQQPVQDAFGLVLVERLRREGYAVQEAAGNRRDPMPPSGEALGFVYEPLEGEVHRLRLQVGSRVLSRAYVERDGRMVPAGPWAQGE